MPIVGCTPDSLYGSSHRACYDREVQRYRLSESMIVLITQRLRLSFRYSSYSLEESRVFRNLCAFFQEIDVLLEVMFARKFPDVS